MRQRFTSTLPPLNRYAQIYIHQILALNVEQAFHEYPVLKDIIEMVEKAYVNGVPPHCLPPSRSHNFDPMASSIFIIQWAEFMKMRNLEIQQIFRHRHILVTGTPTDPMNFDEEGLSTLAPLHQKNVFQGESSI
jgi:hypothetical protein